MLRGLLAIIRTVYGKVLINVMAGESLNFSINSLASSEWFQTLHVM
jgi:hypothetical protein